MRLVKIPVGPGKLGEDHGLGRFVRLMGGVGEFEIEVVYKTDTLRSRMLPGIGVDLSHPETKERFKTVRIYGDTDQDVELLVSEWPTDDNRQQGEISIQVNSGLNGLAERTLGATASSIAANLTRKKIYLSAPDANAQPIWIGSTVANSGLPLEPGDVLLLDITGVIDYIGTANDKLNICEVL